MERNLYFKCACGKHIAIDEAGVGRTVKCTDCGQPIQVPRPEMEWDCSCGLPIILPANMAGETIRCVGCKKSYKVPELEQPEETPKQEPVPVVKTSVPVVKTSVPVVKTSVPVVKTSVPVVKTSVPVSASPQQHIPRGIAVLRPNDKPNVPANLTAPSRPKAVPSMKCPSCGSAVKSEFAICVNCGLNFKTGEKIRSTDETEAPKAKPTMDDSQYYNYIKVKYDKSQTAKEQVELMEGYIKAYPKGKHIGAATALLSNAQKQIKEWKAAQEVVKKRESPTDSGNNITDAQQQFEVGKEGG